MPTGKRAATLSPLHDWEEANTLRMQPGIFLTRGKIDIGFCPAARPWSSSRSNPAAAEPVLQGKIVGIPDPQATLLRRVDQEKTSKGPERLPSQRRFWLLLKDDHSSAYIKEFCSGDQPCQTSSHNDHIGFILHLYYSQNGQFTFTSSALSYHLLLLLLIDLVEKVNFSPCLSIKFWNRP